MAFNPQFWSSGGGLRGITHVSKSEHCSSDDKQSIVPTIVKKINRLDNSIIKLFEKTFRLQTEINKKIGNIIAGSNVNVQRVGDTVTISAVGGGGGGTSNYNELDNKPSINDITLTGNKSLTDLGIQFETNRIKLDLSQYTSSDPLILSTLNAGSYDVVAEGYITGNGTNAQKRKVMQGSILITDGYFCLFVDEFVEPYLVDISDDVSGWGIFGIAEKKYIIGELTHYLTKAEAQSDYATKVYVNNAIGDIDNALTTIVSGGGV